MVSDLAAAGITKLHILTHSMGVQARNRVTDTWRTLVVAWPAAWPPRGRHALWRAAAVQPPSSRRVAAVSLAARPPRPPAAWPPRGAAQLFLAALPRLAEVLLPDDAPASAAGMRLRTAIMMSPDTPLDDFVATSYDQMRR